MFGSSYCFKRHGALRKPRKPLRQGPKKIDSYPEKTGGLRKRKTESQTGEKAKGKGGGGGGKVYCNSLGIPYKMIKKRGQPGSRFFRAPTAIWEPKML